MTLQATAATKRFEVWSGQSASVAGLYIESKYEHAFVCLYLYLLHYIGNIGNMPGS